MFALPSSGPVSPRVLKYPFLSQFCLHRLQTLIYIVFIKSNLRKGKMAFSCYESEAQVSQILRKIDEVYNNFIWCSKTIVSFIVIIKAVEIEFSEESVTEYQHRDKQKEINVLEWISKVIMEPLQVGGVKKKFPKIEFIHLLSQLQGRCTDWFLSTWRSQDLSVDEQDQRKLDQQTRDYNGQYWCPQGQHSGIHQGRSHLRSSGQIFVWGRRQNI